MSPDLTTVIGSVVAAGLGGGAVTGLLNYLRDRRKDKGDVVVSTFTTLQEMNDRLERQAADLQTRLDEERRLRRDLEDTVATERRERRTLEEAVATERRARQALEERIATLERDRPAAEGGTNG